MIQCRCYGTNHECRGWQRRTCRQSPKDGPAEYQFIACTEVLNPIHIGNGRCNVEEKAICSSFPPKSITACTADQGVIPCSTP